MVTKVKAIKKVLEKFGGVATWEQIYDNIEKYYPTAKASKEWKAGIRGVLYREIKNNRNFKKAGFGIYALKEYKEEPKPKASEKRMHSYIEGICLEIGNFEGFLTYTPDKSAIFKDHIHLNQIATLPEIPTFTYPEIVDVVKRIDTIWFNKNRFKYPQSVFEVVDSIGTLSEALNRCLQLIHFNLNFNIVGHSKHKSKFEDKISREPYIRFRDKFDYKDYNTVSEFYDASVKMNEVKKGFFKGL
jgi:hypothetical protein